jgi:hypothetical protein
LATVNTVGDAWGTEVLIAQHITTESLHNKVFFKWEEQIRSELYLSDLDPLLKKSHLQ